jgi:hypothetical protein
MGVLRGWDMPGVFDDVAEGLLFVVGMAGMAISGG